MTKRLARRRTFFVFIVPVVLLIWAQPKAKLYVAGAILTIIGELVRIWSAGHIYKTKELTTTGPFGVVRNPLYFGSFVITCGLCLMAGRPAAWLALPIFFLFHGCAISTEEKLLAEMFGPAFTEYCAKVPRFFPKLNPSFYSMDGFDWKRVLNNKEHHYALTNLALIAAFSVIGMLRHWK